MSLCNGLVCNDWKKRSDRIAGMIAEEEKGSSDVSDHATALFMDMQVAYCAGAWISVIVMSISVIDAHLRDTEALNRNLRTARLLQQYYQGENIDWLRKLRNRYVHADSDNPMLPMNYWFDYQNILEEHATVAMRMTIAALFQSWGT